LDTALYKNVGFFPFLRGMMVILTNFCGLCKIMRPCLLWYFSNWEM